jgi:hypothetical protein
MLIFLKDAMIAQKTKFLILFYLTNQHQINQNFPCRHRTIPLDYKF